MEFYECLEGRRSIRRFTDAAVPHALLEKVVRAASFSPSWKNTQTPRYMAIEDRALLSAVADGCVLGFAHNAEIIKGAPALVLLSVMGGLSGCERDGSYTTALKDRWEMFDAGIAAQSFCLAAHAEGLGTVIMGIFDPEKLAETVGLPEGQKPAALIAIGYPAEAPAMRPRKAVDELLSYR